MSEQNNFLINRVITTGKPVFTATTVKHNTKSEADKDFSNILQEKLNEQTGVKFSKHAEARLKSRNIAISSEKMRQINEAVAKAEKKGVKESLLVMDNMALVVSIKNKTVITAVNSEELKDNVFTNIDGAVIL